MEVIHFNQRQLADRWDLSEATLERWRSEGIGPKFLKLCGRVLYRQVDVEAFEESCLATSTTACWSSPTPRRWWCDAYSRRC
jgi:hypothetical protein